MTRGTEGGSEMAEISALNVAQKAWECWIAADLDGFLSLWHEDGVWTNAGHSQISGARQGRQAIGDVAVYRVRTERRDLQGAPHRVGSQWRRRCAGAERN